ncbi:MAG: GNAT family N-acetyltransferase [Bacteroidota bacterium]
MTSIRPVQAADLPHLKTVIDSSELFPSELLDEMIAGYLQDPAGPDIWLTAEVAEHPHPIAVAYCAPEQMAEGTSNLYLIAIHRDQHSKGIGQLMMTHLEQLLREAGQRVLIVETSGLPEFERTRSFYDQCGYTREAVIRDFYQEGEDKVVFWKKL